MLITYHSRFDRPNNIEWAVQIIKLPIMWSFPPPVTAAPYSQTHSAYVPPSRSATKFHNHIQNSSYTCEVRKSVFGKDCLDLFYFRTENRRTSITSVYCNSTGNYCYIINFSVWRPTLFCTYQLMKIPSNATTFIGTNRNFPKKQVKP